jgi:hypothetical protein
VLLPRDMGVRSPPSQLRDSIISIIKIDDPSYSNWQEGALLMRCIPVKVIVVRVHDWEYELCA